MKKSIYLISFILLGIVVTTAIFSCEKDDSKETCFQDEFCTAKLVTTCCDDNDVCVWKYDGKEYTEDQGDELAKLLGCGTTSMVFKSAGEEEDLANIIIRLKALMHKAQKQIKSDK